MIVVIVLWWIVGDVFFLDFSEDDWLKFLEDSVCDQLSVGKRIRQNRELDFMKHDLLKLENAFPLSRVTSGHSRDTYGTGSGKGKGTA